MVALFALFAVTAPAWGQTPDYIPAFQYQGSGYETSSGSAGLAISTYQNVVPKTGTAAVVATLAAGQAAPESDRDVFVMATSSANAVGGFTAGYYRICQCTHLDTNGDADGGCFDATPNPVACAATSPEVFNSLPWASGQDSAVAAAYIFTETAGTKYAYTLQHVLAPGQAAGSLTGGDTTVAALVLTTGRQGHELGWDQDEFARSTDPSGATNAGTRVTYVTGLTEQSTITAMAYNAGVVTVTANGHGLLQWDRVSIRGVKSGSPTATDDGAYNGDFYVATASANQFTYNTYGAPNSSTIDFSGARFGQNAWGIATMTGKKNGTNNQNFYRVTLNKTGNLPAALRAGNTVVLQDVNLKNDNNYNYTNGFKPIAYDGVTGGVPAGYVTNPLGGPLGANEFIYLTPNNSSDATIVHTDPPLHPFAVSAVRPLSRNNATALSSAPFLYKNDPTGAHTPGNELEAQADTSAGGASAYSVPIRDVFFSFSANVAQELRGPWLYGDFQVYFQAPGSSTWEPVPESQIYSRAVDGPVAGLRPDYGLVHIVGRHRTNVNNAGIYKYRVKVDVQAGGSGVKVTNGVLLAVSLSWNGGYFKTIYADARNLNQLKAGVFQWVDFESLGVASVTNTSTNRATIEMGTPSNNANNVFWEVGQKILVSGSGTAAFNGFRLITARPGPTQIEYECPGCTGTASNPSQIKVRLAFATDEFPGINAATPYFRKAFVALSSYNYVTKGNTGAAKVNTGVGVSDTADSGSNPAFGNTQGGNGVVPPNKSYQGVVPAACVPDGFTRGCEVGSLSSVAIASSFAVGQVAPFRGRGYSDLTGNNGALNMDLVLLELGSYGPTYAPPVDVTGRMVNGKAVISFTTEGELGTASFRAVRRDGNDWVAVGPKAVPALPPWPPGATYEIEDDAAVGGQTYEYGVIEMQTNGNELFHGPYAVTIQPGGTAAPSARTVGVLGESALAFKRTLKEEPNSPVVRPGLSSGDLPWAKSSWKAYVSEEGIYSIPLSSVDGPETSRNHGLSNQGAPVAFINDGANKRLLFYGTPLMTPYTDRNAYLLRPKQPNLMKEVNGKGPKPTKQPDSFMYTTHFEKDVWPGFGWLFDQVDDFWFWQTFTAPSSAVLPFTAPLVDAAGGLSSISFSLYNWQDAPGVADVQFDVLVNGLMAGRVSADGRGMETATLTFPSSLLNRTTGANTLEISAILGAGVPQSWWMLNGFDLTYPRRFEAHGDQARVIASSGQQVVTVHGFSKPGIMVLEVSDRLNPILVNATTVFRAQDGRYSVTFPSTSGAEFFVSAAAIPEASLLPLVDAGLRAKKAGARHLVIAPYDLYASAQELAGQRSSTGLSSIAVPLEAVWDEFGEGLPSPKALRDFLLYASSSWAPAPGYVALAGKGTYDPKNIRRQSDCLIPTNFVVAAAPGLAGTDVPYVLGTSISIGRIPVTNGADLHYFNQKLAQHESQTAPSKHVTLLTGETDPKAGDFPKGAEEIASALRSGYTYSIKSLGSSSFNDVRQEAFTALKRGDSVVGWVGHGGYNRLANEGVLTVSDVPALVTNGSRLSILAGATCNINAFYFAGVTYLGEKLVTQAGGGALASFTPTNQSYNEVSVPMIRRFVGEVHSGKGSSFRLGDAVRGAMGPYDSNAPGEYVLWQLLGDPGSLIQ